MCTGGVFSHEGQCCRFSRNTAYVTLKIIYFYYQKNIIIGSKFPKNNNLILKKTSLFVTHRYAGSVNRELPTSKDVGEQPEQPFLRVAWLLQVQRATAHWAREVVGDEVVALLYPPQEAADVKNVAARKLLARVWTDVSRQWRYADGAHATAFLNIRCTPVSVLIFSKLNKMFFLGTLIQKKYF